MKKGRNLVLCGLSNAEKNSTYIEDVREYKDMWEEDDEYSHRFPYVVYVDTLEEAFNHRGFMLIINYGIDNIIEIDKKYRKKFKNYNMIICLDENFHNLHEFGRKDKYSGIYKMDREYLYGGFYQDLNDIYQKFKEEELSKKDLTLKVINKIHPILEFLKAEGSLKTKQIEEKFEYNAKSIERYMNYINILYNNVGYDYSKNEWYITK